MEPINVVLFALVAIIISVWFVEFVMALPKEASYSIIGPNYKSTKQGVGAEFKSSVGYVNYKSESTTRKYGGPKYGGNCSGLYYRSGGV